MQLISPSRKRARKPALIALAALAAIALVATQVAPSASAASATAAKAPKKCANSKLVVWFAKMPGDGTAGSVFYELAITNLGNSTCTLRGYPTVTAANLGGGKVGSAATHESGTPVKTVTLQSGDTATATLRIAEAGNFSPSTCHPVMAAGLRVRAPGNGGSKLVPFPFEACARKGHTNLGVRAVEG
jgi:hypothetical protein